VSNQLATLGVGGAGASAPFDPSSIAGLRLWLKADSESYSDNASVTTWHDRSGNGNDATPGHAPVFKTGILNGKPVVRFDGVITLLQTAGLVVSTSQPSTVYAVVIPRARPASYAPVYIDGVASNSTGFRMVLATSGSTWGTYNGSDVNAGTGLVTNSPYLLGMLLDGSGNGAFRTNGATDGTWAGGSSGSGLGVDRIGADGSGRFAQVDIAEILLYDSALGSTDRDNVESYLNSKYAVY
jgi:hypothetical protein